MLFLDLSNVFDTIPHDKLLLKLCSLGITGDYLLLIKNSITGRYQFTSFNNICSQSVKIRSGVPQGGVLSPEEFNMYVSDIPEILKCNNFEFADDLVIISIVKNTNDIDILQSDLLNLENYCNEKELKLNAQKTKHLRIGLKDCNLSGYVLQNEIIETVNSHKHLGVTYDNKMSFNFHCNDIINKAYSKYNVMKHICNQVDGQTFLRIYKTYTTYCRIQ